MGIPWTGLFGVSLIVAAAVLAGLLVRAWRWRKRQRGTRLPHEAAPEREARRLPGRLFVETTIVGGPKAGGFTRVLADLVIGPSGLMGLDGTGQRVLLAATQHGRVLQIDPARPGRGFCTGPGRLVLEGMHPSGLSRVRLEVMVDDAEAWAASVTRTFPSA